MGRVCKSKFKFELTTENKGKHGMYATSQKLAFIHYYGEAIYVSYPIWNFS